MNLWEEPAHVLKDLLARGEIGSRELVLAFRDRIEAVEDRVKAYLSLSDEEVLRQAEAIDRDRSAGKELPELAGIPMALKDNMVSKGLPTTCASRMLEDFHSPYDATVAERLKERRTLFLGKTNLDEFAMGSSTEHSAFYPTHNPWDLNRVPGGSSGGSAAAVAAGEAAWALGSDTGGSIRQPAAFCGVVGLKPTYGRVSRYGLVAFGSSLDQIGPLTRDVTDAALVLKAIAGHDARDATSVPREVPDYTDALRNDVRGLRVGVPKEYFAEGIQPEVKEAVLAAIKLFADLGAHVEETSLPRTDAALSAYYVIAAAEASSNLARFDGVRYGFRKKAESFLEMYEKTRGEGFGPEVQRRIMLGTYALSAGYYDAYYLKAQKVRTLVLQDFQRAFDKYDILVAPTVPVTAFRIGEMLEDPVAMYMIDVCTIPANLAGIPALSLPCGYDNGLPIGLQIMGKAFDESTVLRAAYTFEQNTDYHKQRAPLTGAGEDLEVRA